MLEEREYAEWGMQLIQTFLDVLDERMEELGRDSVTREELHNIARGMRVKFRELTDPNSPGEGFRRGGYLGDAIE